MNLTCEYFAECSGCDLWDKSYSQQIVQKKQNLKETLETHKIQFSKSIGFVSAGESQLRHRCDFTIQYDESAKKHVFGFYNRSKNIIQIDRCLQLSPELQKVYSDFIQFKFFYNNTPLKKGSVRLRVSPNGAKGCWLDFSNVEIKHFLDDKVLLEQLLDAGFSVEIGQKGKKLMRENTQLKLTDPEPNSWFQTADASKKILPLKCLISDFTQPSWISAEKLVDTTMNWLQQSKNINSILEFGSGIGQFSIPFLSTGAQLTCCEINESSAEQLVNNVKDLDLTDNFQLLIGDFHKKSLQQNKKFDLAFVNPARSGLKNFTDEIIKTGADYIIYVSCFPETMSLDISKLSEHYELCDIIIIDQFPQTAHYEICSFLKKLS
ncbi:RsmD family RNA methyltransferase [bacterium]|nr:RsmD family RNA methyltransferase [bacterium]